MGALSGEVPFDAVRSNLALPTLGGFLWDPQKTSALNASSLAVAEGAELANADFLEGIRHLAYTRQGKVLRPVDYKNLGAEELGGVYESLLALTPQVSGDGARFSFAEFAGSERKTSGSYYTPDSLVQCLLDSALDPVVENAIKGKSGKEAEEAILALKICDPAVGSGHFLVGAAHRLARHLARVRAQTQGESEPSPMLYQHALRDIIGRCLYGVDINPMAAELCRVSLWLEAMDPGKPLSFLEHRIKCGNSLLGTTPALLKKGIPDEAFKPIAGDDKEYCSKFRKSNKQERDSEQRQLFDREMMPWDRLGDLPAAIANIDEIPDDEIAQIEKKRSRYHELVESSDYLNIRFWADTWCAAFVWEKNKQFAYPITEEEFRKIERNPHDVPGWMRDEIVRLAQQYQFFHWHLQFPEVFAKGGFDCVLGNPPWEQLERESAGKADREMAGTQHLIEHSSRYPLTGRGRKNLYGLFSELAAKDLGHDDISVGMVVPTGILQDSPAAILTENLVRSGRLASAYDFENRRKGKGGDKWFPDVDSRQRFCLITMMRGETKVRFVFDVVELSEIRDSSRAYSQSFEDIGAFCESGFKVPMFRSAKDACIASRSYRAGVMLGNLLRRDAPRLSSGLVFNFDRATNEQKVRFSPQRNLDGLSRVFEGTYIHQFDHRFSTFDFGSTRYVSALEKQDPRCLITTETYLPVPTTEDRLRSLIGEVPSWFVVLRRQARATDAVTSICAIVPFGGAEGNLTAFFCHNGPG
ncbi:MAG: N-6 DNA methylase, partial [bacterium]